MPGEDSGEDRGRRGGGAAIVAGAQALALYAACVLGGPWLRSSILRVLPVRAWSDHLLDAAMLGAAGLVAFLLTRPVLGAHSRLGSGGARGSVHSGGSRARGLQAASAALFLLGLCALALRLADPAYDQLELGGRGLDSPAALAGFLALLPLGVAAEEVVFRSCQSRLRVFLRPRAAAVVVALGFAAYHWVPGFRWDRHRIETELALVAGGLILAAAYEKTASLPLLIGVHLIYDNLAVVQAWLNVGQAHGAEAVLFLLWLTVSGALAGTLGQAPNPRRSGRLGAWTKHAS